MLFFKILFSFFQPSHHPGDCWAMEGQSGYATIKVRKNFVLQSMCQAGLLFAIFRCSQMSAKAVVTSVTVDHIPEVWSPNGTRSSAPKNFTVYVSDSKLASASNTPSLFFFP